MEHYDKHIDDLFKEALDSHAETPPAAVWEALEQRLDGKEKRRGGFFFKSIYIVLIAATLLIAASIWGGLWLQSDSNTDNKASIQATNGSAATNKATSANSMSAAKTDDTVSPPTAAKNTTVIKTAKTKDNKASITAEADKRDANATVAKETVNAQAPQPDNIINAAGAVNSEEHVAASQPLPAYVEKTSKKHNIGVTETGLDQPANATAYYATGKPAVTNVAATPQVITKEEPKKVAPLANNVQQKHVHEETIIIPQTKPVAENKKEDNPAVATVTTDKADNVKSMGANHKKAKTKAIERKSMAPIVAVQRKKLKQTKPIKTTPEAAATKADDKTPPVAVNKPVKKEGKHKQAAVKQPAVAKNTFAAVKQPVKKESKHKQVAAKQPAVAKNTVAAMSQPAKAKKPQHKQKKNAALTPAAVKNVQTAPVAANVAVQPNAQPIANVPPVVVPAAKVPVPATPAQKDAVVNNNTAIGTGGGTAGTADSAAKKVHRAMKLAAGVKVGFESGTSSDASKKIVVAPYLEYSIGKRFSVMTQPAIKATQVSSLNMGSSSYYKVNNDVTTTPEPLLIANIPGNYYIVTYHYTQSHDSIVKSYKYGGKYIETELPILLKYKLAQKFSLYGGVNINYSRFVKIAEKTLEVKGIQRSGDSTSPVPTQNPYAQTAPPVSAVITYQGTSISGYNGPLYQGQNGGVFRLGYMAGVSYEFTNRWTADLLVQQSSAKQNVVAGYDLNKPLSLPYFRFMIGYRLSENLFHNKQ